MTASKRLGSAAQPSTAASVRTTAPPPNPSGPATARPTAPAPSTAGAGATTKLRSARRSTQAMPTFTDNCRNCRAAFESNTLFVNHFLCDRCLPESWRVTLHAEDPGYDRLNTPQNQASRGPLRRARHRRNPLRLLLGQVVPLPHAGRTHQQGSQLEQRTGRSLRHRTRRPLRPLPRRLAHPPRSTDRLEERHECPCSPPPPT